MFAGHDTTTAAVVFALNFITENDRILSKCRSELNSIFGNSSRSPTFDDVKELKYLEACIKEALRLRGPVREFFRELPHGGVVPVDGINYYIIPNATIMIVADYIHHEAKHYKNPFEFRLKEPF